jgi:hypothetical protein
LLISSRVVASVTRRIRPAQCGHTVTSTANTRANSHAHGCRDGRSLVDDASRGLLVGEHARRIVGTLERATVPREYASEPLVDPGRDLHHLLGRGVGQAME